MVEHHPLVYKRENHRTEEKENLHHIKVVVEKSDETKLRIDVWKVGLDVEGRLPGKVPGTSNTFNREKKTRRKEDRLDVEKDEG